MTPADQHALREALAYLTPDPASHGTISLRSDKARAQVAVIEAAFASLIAERDAAVAENEGLRFEIEAIGQENDDLEQAAEDSVTFEARALAAEAENTRLKDTVEAAVKEADRVLTAATEMSAILLMAGEMTAQERRTARAVANGLATKVRSVLATIPPKENPDA